MMVKVKVMVALSGTGLDITLLGTLGGAAPGDRDKYQSFSYKNIRNYVALWYVLDNHVKTTMLPPTVTMVLLTVVTGVRPDTVTVALHW